jgi:hypothetical protein
LAVGEKIGKNQTDRGKLGAKRHNIVDQNWIPLALVLSGANVHDRKEHDHSWSSLVVPRPNPVVLEQNGREDNAYDFPACRKTLAKKRYGRTFLTEAWERKTKSVIPRGVGLSKERVAGSTYFER